MDLTGNYGLKKPGQNDAYNIQNENDNMDILDREMKIISDANAEIYLTTNIGNNYSVAISNLTTFTDGYPLTVKFNAASTGPITINTKGVVDYFGKPVTNVRENLIANLRYESNAGNFILLGKGGGGNALPSQILKDATCTTDNGPIVGIIPSKGAQIYVPSSTDQIISKGQYILEDQIIKGEPNLIAANIKSGVILFGITGTYTAYSPPPASDPSYSIGSASLNASSEADHTFNVSTPNNYVIKSIVVSFTGKDNKGLPVSAIRSVGSSGNDGSVSGRSEAGFRISFTPAASGRTGSLYVQAFYCNVTATATVTTYTN